MVTVVTPFDAWVVMAQYEQMVGEALERGRLARLQDRRHQAATRTRVAVPHARSVARPPNMHPTAPASP